MASHSTFALYDAAIAADKAWSIGLRAAYGKEACNARYDRRGKATAEMASLRDAKLAADEAWRVAAFPHARSAAA